jgi:hypothetical protein
VAVGLSLQVGAEEDCNWAAFDALSRALVEAGLPPHHEPHELPDSQTFSCQMWGYSGLHCLRRLAAYLEQGIKVPAPGNNDSSDDPVLQACYDQMAPGFQHLVLHSDAEGFYVPIDFDEVLFPRDELNIPRGMIGSSVRLLHECRRLAEWLELPQDMDCQGEEMWDAADDPPTDGPKWKRFAIESFSCVGLMRASEASIASGAAIAFC